VTPQQSDPAHFVDGQRRSRTVRTPPVREVLADDRYRANASRLASAMATEAQQTDIVGEFEALTDAAAVLNGRRTQHGDASGEPA